METKFTEWLAQQITERQWSIREFARQGKISHTSVSNVLSGQTTPSGEFCIAVARALSLDTEYVLGLAGHAPRIPPPAEELTMNPLRDRALVLFLLDSGCRATELCGLQVGDVDVTKGRVRVMGKGSKERVVYVGKRTRQAIWVYLKQERPTPMQYQSAHVFLTQDGYPLDRTSLRLIVYRLGRRAGLKLWTHLFRHTAAVERLRRGMNLVTLQAFLGHEKLETTRGYLTSLSDADVERSAAATSPVDDWRL